METTGSTNRKQGIRNRPPSHDRFGDHYDNSVKLELEYTYTSVNTQGISQHLLRARILMAILLPLPNGFSLRLLIFYSKFKKHKKYNYI